MARSMLVTLASGLALSIAQQGDPSGPALVVLPGVTDSWRSYDRVQAALPSSIRAVAVSQRGHGDSEKPATGYGVDDFAGDTLELLDELGIEQAVIAGHSGSCLIARRLAIDVPERVTGLVLEASPVTLGRYPAFARFVATVAELDDPIDREFLRQFAAADFARVSNDATLEAAVDELSKVPSHVWREMFRQMLHYDDTAELARISTPALLIWGDADERVGRAAQEELVSVLGQAELVVYPGAGHAPRHADPARFAGDVAAFVDRVAR